MSNPNRQRANIQNGFSVIELVVVIALITTILGIAAGTIFVLQGRSTLDSETERLASTLRLARSKTLAAENFSQHGVHFDNASSTYTLFEGGTFNQGAAGNETARLDERVAFNAVTVGTSSDPDVVFERVSGTTDDNGYIELVDVNDPSETRVICVEETGSVVVLDASQDPADCEPAAVEFTGGTTDAQLTDFPSAANGDAGQSFTTGATPTTVGRVDLFLRYVDDDSDDKDSDLLLEIRENSTAGSVLGRSLIVKGADVSNNALAWQQFTFPRPVELTAGTQYFLRLRSLPDATEPLEPYPEEIVHWGYEQTTASPYAGGDAWRHIGANGIPSSQGQRLDQYDFSFRVFEKEPPPEKDWRTLDFNLGFTLRGHAVITLNFGGITTTEITVNDFMDLNQTEFDWEDTIVVNGERNHLRIHSRYIDANDTVLHVHRGCDENETPVDIDIDTVDLVEYSSGACSDPPNNMPIKGGTIEDMIAR